MASSAQDCELAALDVHRYKVNGGVGAVMLGQETRGCEGVDLHEAPPRVRRVSSSWRGDNTRRKRCSSAKTNQNSSRSTHARLARDAGARTILPIATAALREARNGAKVATQIGKALGTRVRVITGDEEARLAFRAFQRRALLPGQTGT